MADHLDGRAAVIARAYPELRGAAFRILAEGWDSAAVEVDGRLIFKFPKSEAAEKRLLKEASLLAVIRPRVSLPVPEMRFHHGPPVFSCHNKLHGEHLLAEDYGRLSETARDRLGAALGGFYAELHRLERRELIAAGAGPIEAWQSPQTVRTKALPKLDRDLCGYAEAIVSTFERLSPEPCGTTYGFFDGHGWNMAFDHDRARLNGIYDFADSGFGPLHQEFIYTNFISPDLTRRVIDAYETSSGRKLDRQRISILTGFHRLSELAALADQPRHVPAMIGHVAAWAAAEGQ